MTGSKRGGFSIAEVLVALGMFVILISLCVWIFGYGSGATRRLTPKLTMAASSRKAVVRMLREIQEGMEVILPMPGITLPYAVIIDKIGLARWYYQVPNKNDANLTDLMRYVNDKKIAPGARSDVLLTGISRLTFTSQSEGMLSINLALQEDSAEYSMLTQVRLRDLASSEELW